MSRSLYHIEHLRPALESGCLIVTPNRRLSAKIRQAWSLAHSNQVIASANVHALDDWLYKKWQEACYRDTSATLPQLLTATRATILWEQVIARSDHGLLMSDRAIARLAASADDLLQQWLVDPDTLPPSADSELLQQWITDFEAILAKHHYTTTWRAQRLLLDTFKQQPPAIDRIVLTGFDNQTPLAQQLLEHSGANLDIIEPNINEANQSSEVKLNPCSDGEQELHSAAQWAENVLQQHPDTRVGIIVPELNQQRARVERIFQTVFEPQYILPTQPRYAAPFNISAGEPLSQQPVIACAFLLLNLNHYDLKLNDTLALLHSPFWGNSDMEIEQRSNAELALRERQWDSLGLATLRNSFTENGAVFQRLSRFENLRFKGKQRFYPGEWLDLIQQQLQHFHWPGSRRLDSVEFQQAQHFQSVLEEFASLDDVLGSISFADALSHLQLLCQQTVFQAQTQDSPIQILGLLEGSGLNFDFLWICGMGQRQWPPAPDPHPLLPLPLQIEQDMPHCSVQREVQFARSISDRLLHSAAQIVISWPQQLDESPQPVSTFFDTYPLHATPSTPAGHCYQQLLTQNTRCELLQDDNGPALAVDDSGRRHARGGQALLKAQAMNPFDAFSQYRLNATPLKESCNGLPKFLRGNLIHKALHFIWQQLGTQQALLQLDEPQQNTLIHDSIDHALRHTRPHPSLSIESLRGIEIHQLAKHLHHWLQQESRRPPFTVANLEHAIEYELNGLNFSLVIDRIDSIGDNQLLLIDYKTTRAGLSSTQWQGERLAEPQLPLYSLTNEHSQGISFAQVNLTSMKFVSLGSSANMPDGAKQLEADQWQEQRGLWQQHLSALAAEILQGYAAVQYTSTPPSHATQNYCLNRWPEQALINELVAKDNPEDKATQ